MKLIVGLGNPGEKYEKTRHNVGFLAINNLQLTVNHFPDWKFNKRFNAEISKGEIDDEKVILAKPQTFMNASGRAVKKLIGNWKLEIGNLFVIHDDIDLPLGKIRIRKKGSSGGHKGIQSIIGILKTENFVRFRIGIRPTLQPKIWDASKFVLKNFTKEEKKIIGQSVKKTAEAIEAVLSEGIGRAMNQFN